MALKVEVIGTLTKDPMPTKNEGTMFKVRSFGKEITCFNKVSSAESRLEYGGGDRIRAEGNGVWNEYRDEISLTASNCGVDGSDDEDRLKIRVDGSYNHDLVVQYDDADEGGGKYIPVEIEATVRGKDSTGEWADLITYVQAMVLGKAVDKLMAFDKEGITNLCFIGDLSADPEFIKGTPAFYAEITDIEQSKGRSGNDDAFWNSKPRGLANRKSAPVKPSKKGGGGGGSSGGPNDELPF